MANCKAERPFAQRFARLVVGLSGRTPIGPRSAAAGRVADLRNQVLPSALSWMDEPLLPISARQPGVTPTAAAAKAKSPFECRHTRGRQRLSRWRLRQSGRLVNRHANDAAKRFAVVLWS